MGTAVPPVPPLSTSVVQRFIAGLYPQARGEWEKSRARHQVQFFRVHSKEDLQRAGARSEPRTSLTKMVQSPLATLVGDGSSEPFFVVLDTSR